MGAQLQVVLNIIISSTRTWSMFNLNHNLEIFPFPSRLLETLNNSRLVKIKITEVSRPQVKVLTQRWIESNSWALLFRVGREIAIPHPQRSPQSSIKKRLNHAGRRRIWGQGIEESATQAKSRIIPFEVQVTRLSSGCQHGSEPMSRSAAVSLHRESWKNADSPANQCREWIYLRRQRPKVFYRQKSP
jgi:hypothetical protein